MSDSNPFEDLRAQALSKDEVLQAMKTTARDFAATALTSAAYVHVTQSNNSINPQWQWSQPQPGTAVPPVAYPNTPAPYTFVSNITPCVGPHVVGDLAVGMAGVLEGTCRVCGQEFRVAKLPQGVLKDQLTAIIHQIIDTDDEDVMVQLAVELQIVLQDAENTLQDMHSLKELADALISSRTNPPVPAA